MTAPIQLDNGVWALPGDQLTANIISAGKLDCDNGAAGHCHYIPVGGVAVDAGASFGDCTICYGRAAGLTGHVFAFEPTPDSFSCLSRNMADLPWVEPIKQGLSNTTGFKRFIVDTHNHGASKIVRDNERSDLDISVTTLDSYQCFFTRFDFFKIDVEGHEIEVLQGATFLILKYRPVMVIEINKGCLAASGRAMQDLFNVLRELNYDFSNADNGSKDFSPAQFDVICFPK